MELQNVFFSCSISSFCISKVNLDPSLDPAVQNVYLCIFFNCSWLSFCSGEYIFFSLSQQNNIAGVFPRMHGDVSSCGIIWIGNRMNCVSFPPIICQACSVSHACLWQPFKLLEHLIFGLTGVFLFLGQLPGVGGPGQQTGSPWSASKAHCNLRAAGAEKKRPSAGGKRTKQTCTSQENRNGVNP